MEIFEIKPQILFGNDALSYINTMKGRRVFIVTDPYMVESNMILQVTSRLTNKDYHIFSNIVPDPPMELVVKGIEEVIAFKPDSLIALGGGSAIDAAKAIMHFSRKIGNLGDMNFIAIPTTSGTGSEVTSFAVITDPQKGIKYPLVDKELLPDIAILDASLVKSVPAPVVADTGLDVLTHAVEAYVSTKATDFTDALAEKAVCLVFEYLIRSYSHSDDAIAKEKMHHASCLAGLAFDRTSLGINHAIAHNIGARLKIPHGRANAILLPHVIEFNANIDGYQPSSYTPAAKRYAHLASLVGLQGSNIRISVKNFIHEIQKMQKAMKMPLNFKECKVKPDDFHKSEKDIAKGALQDACILTNPRIASEKDVLDIMKKAL